MRNRIFEISAVLAGIGIVLAIYFYREGPTPLEQQAAPQPVVEQPARPVSTPLSPSDRPIAESASPVVTPAPVAEVDFPVVDEAELQSAQSIWQAAVADIERVEAELDVLDIRFDAKEAELAEMESQGMDPETLEEEMLIFLDGIVDEYDELETRLAEAEALQADAAERLGRITGSAPEVNDPDEY
jgi:hypothetical protein